MVAWVESSRAETAPVPAARPRPRARRQTAERRLAGGVLWIGVLAVLLVGVVALNVAVLRLNMQLEELARERAELRAQNALLSAQLATAAAPHRVEGRARGRLGLVPATDPAYVDLNAKR
jgi:cell division protein FtsL